MTKKLDPDLRRRTRTYLARAALSERAAEAEPAERVETIVEFTGDVADLIAVGFEARSVIEHQQKGYKIATGTISVDRLEDLAAIDHVVEVEGPRRMRPLLDYSLPEIRADVVHTGSQPFNGEGVAVGIIDTGIDWRHGAFIKEDGTSRILAIWDQRLSATGSETKGLGDIGVVYSRQQISDALKGVGTVRSLDKDGHGTHVAGIAAGNGAPASCCHTPATYVGVAPKADLVVVRVGSNPDPSKAVGENTRIVDALDFIFNQSPAAGLPIVVNISLGDNLGAHDGTSEVERAIDAAIFGFGARAVVVAAGNFARTDKDGLPTRCHVKGTVPGNDDVEVEFEVREGNDESAYLDLWYERAGTLHIEVIAHGGATSGTVHHGLDHSFIANPAADAKRRSRVFIDGTANGNFNRDNNFRIKIAKPQSGNLPHGQWKFKLTNPNAAPVNFHCWIDRGDDIHEPIFLSPVDPPDGKVRASSDSTLGVPSTAAEAITVANHASRTSCCNCWPSHDIVASSSHGPVARNAAANPKPDIAAPGLEITSAKADAANLRGNCCACCPDACCCLYQDLTGTSMAAPHVAGAIALMLQKNRRLTRLQILQHLQATARPAPAGGTRETWGAGKLNVKDAVDAVAAPVAPGGGGGGGPAIYPPFDDEKIANRKPFSPLRAKPVIREIASGRFDPGGDPLSAAVRLLRARIDALPQGQELAAVISRHFSEARRLINTNRRVAAMWHRAGGPKLLRRLLQGAIEEDAPAAIESPAQREYLEQWCDLLARYGSQKLSAAVKNYRCAVLKLLQVPLATEIPAETRIDL
jgi:subtilisin family serine protease